MDLNIDLETTTAPLTDIVESSTTTLEEDFQNQTTVASVIEQEATTFSGDDLETTTSSYDVSTTLEPESLDDSQNNTTSEPENLDNAPTTSEPDNLEDSHSTTTFEPENVDVTQQITANHSSTESNFHDSEQDRYDNEPSVNSTKQKSSSNESYDHKVNPLVEVTTVPSIQNEDEPTTIESISHEHQETTTDSQMVYEETSTNNKPPTPSPINICEGQIKEGYYAVESDPYCQR